MQTETGGVQAGYEEKLSSRRMVKQQSWSLGSLSGLVPQMFSAPNQLKLRVTCCEQKVALEIS